MRLLAIVPSIYNTSPGQRFRLEQWEPLLREQGVEITYAPFETDELHRILYQSGKLGQKARLVADAFKHRLSLINSASQYDACYIFREAALLGPPIVERKLGRLGVPIVFDFDDAIFVSYRSPSNGYLSYLKFAGKTSEICRLSSHVMVGNPYLAEYARQYNDSVTVIPTTIDVEKYLPKPKNAASDIPVIGWTGSFSTVQHLDNLREPLQELARRKRFRLRVIGTPKYHLEGVDVEAMQWRSESEIEDLRPIDIGIMPLPDDAWSKGKCGLKALQFMALGIPVVCSPVGVNTDIIDDGVNGSLASSGNQWIDKLGTLLRSADLRSRLGNAGRETVRSRYSATVQAPRVYDILKSVVVKARSEVAQATNAKSAEARA